MISFTVQNALNILDQLNLFYSIEKENHIIIKLNIFVILLINSLK
jgi:hypothetical protein